ncbi:OmpG family monomeric porin, partial [Escherichia coli]|uniref:OmpG family monomeric porin n=1 Tax=Escherichia coli TaxID=562 RepID=UPI00201FD8E9
LVYCKMSVGSTHHLEMVFVWKQNYILVDEYFFFCCTWIVNSAGYDFQNGLSVSLEYAFEWQDHDEGDSDKFHYAGVGVNYSF